MTQWEAGFQNSSGSVSLASDAAGNDRGAAGVFRPPRAFGTSGGTDGTARRNPCRTIDSPACPQRPNDFLRPHEDRALLNAECAHQHRIVVWLLRYTGVRVAEAQALTIVDLDLTAGCEAVTVRGGKTAAATRTVPLLPQLLPLIHEHLEFLRRRMTVTPETPVLATCRATPMTTNYLWRVVKRVAYEAGVRPIPCGCATRRQDRHARGCPRTISGEYRSSISPHTLRRPSAAISSTAGFVSRPIASFLGTQAPRSRNVPTRNCLRRRSAESCLRPSRTTRDRLVAARSPLLRPGIRPARARRGRGRCARLVGARSGRAARRRRAGRRQRAATRPRPPAVRSMNAAAQTSADQAR